MRGFVARVCRERDALTGLLADLGPALSVLGELRPGASPTPAVRRDYAAGSRCGSFNDLTRWVACASPAREEMEFDRLSYALCEAIGEDE